MEKEREIFYLVWRGEVFPVHEEALEIRIKGLPILVSPKDIPSTFFAGRPAQGVKIILGPEEFYLTPPGIATHRGEWVAVFEKQEAAEEFSRRFQW